MSDCRQRLTKPIKNFAKRISYSKVFCKKNLAYSKSCLTSKVEHFAKIVNGLKSLFLLKNRVLDVFSVLIAPLRKFGKVWPTFATDLAGFSRPDCLCKKFLKGFCESSDLNKEDENPQKMGVVLVSLLLTLNIFQTLF